MPTLRGESSQIKKKLQQLTEKILPQEVQGIRRDPESVSAKVSRASGYLQSSWDAPNDTERKAVAQAQSAIEAFVGEVEAFFEQDWKAFKKAAQSADLKLFPDEEE